MILVTGAAGFIGFHVTKKLLGEGYSVVGLDNLNDYYDPQLKKDRIKHLQSFPDFHFHQVDISDLSALQGVWNQYCPVTHVFNFAAQPGVRYSIQNPHPYVMSNVVGFLNILECCRHEKGFQHLIYASTSSIYGMTEDLPFTEDQRCDLPVSLYAATKRSGELIAQSYYHLYGLPMTGLRFFTVYGPWGRPDMAAYKFVTQILNGEPIDVYNEGDLRRDFTFIDDIVAGIWGAFQTKPKIKEGQHHPLYNLGNHRSENLLTFIEEIEKGLGRKALKTLKPMQPGDVYETYAGIELAQQDLGFDPQTPISIGIPKFIEWYKDYHGVEFF